MPPFNFHTLTVHQFFNFQLKTSRSYRVFSFDLKNKLNTPISSKHLQHFPLSFVTFIRLRSHCNYIYTHIYKYYKVRYLAYGKQRKKGASAVWLALSLSGTLAMTYSVLGEWRFNLINNRER